MSKKGKSWVDWCRIGAPTIHFLCVRLPKKAFSDSVKTNPAQVGNQLGFFSHQVTTLSDLYITGAPPSLIPPIASTANPQAKSPPPPQASFRYDFSSPDLLRCLHVHLRPAPSDKACFLCSIGEPASCQAQDDGGLAAPDPFVCHQYRQQSDHITAFSALPHS